MKFIHRLAYYLGGFSIGLVILLFILNKKEASCDYTPGARVKKNISIKPKVFSEDAMRFLAENRLDTTQIFELISYGKVDFSESKTREEICNQYTLYSRYQDDNIKILVHNCPDTAKIVSLSRKPR